METMAHWFSFRFAKKSWVNPQLFLLLIILAIAAFFRLYKITDYMTFLGDEGRDALVVYDILHGKFTLLGPTASVGGFFLGPLYYYFMAPFLLLFQYDPVGPAVMVALFGVATVLLLYKMGSEFFGEKAGLISAGLYAIAPLVIAYSRSSWNPNLMPFFSLLTIYCVYKAVVSEKNLYFVLSGVFLGIAMQLHYLTVFLATIVECFIIVTQYKNIINFVKASLSLFIGFLLGWSFFLAFEIRHGFPNIQSILNFIFHSGETGGNEKFLPTIQDVFYRLFSRLITNFPPADQITSGARGNILLWYYGTLLLIIAAVGILIFKLWETRKTQNEFFKYLLLFFWLAFGIGLFGFYKKPIYDYYFGFIFPLPFLLISMVITYIYNFKKNEIVPKVLAVAIFVLLLLVNVQDIPFLSPGNRQKQQVEEIANFVLSKTDNKQYNFALITGGNSDHAYRYFFTLRGKDPLTIENTQNDPERKTVTDQLLIVCEQSPCKPLGHPIWEIAGFGRADIAGEWNVSVVKIYKLIHYKGK